MNMSLHTLLFRAYHAQTKRLTPVLEELGLGRGQPKILNYLSVHGKCAQSEIASYFDLDPASISRMVETLGRNGFITVGMDSGCRRRNILSITEKGKDAIDRWHTECQAVEERMLYGFSDMERESFHTLLEKAYMNLEATGGNKDA